jgi:hypothetical protein
MYADTTYCDPKYVFPPQHESIQYVVRTLLQAMRATPAGKTLCVVSTYGIGKERILAAVAAALHCKVAPKPPLLPCRLMRWVAAGFEAYAACW